MGGSPTRQEPVTKLRNGCPPRTIPTQHAGPGCQPHPAVPQVPRTLPTACCTYLQDFHALIRAPSVPTLRTACVSALRASHCCVPPKLAPKPRHGTMPRQRGASSCRPRQQYNTTHRLRQPSQLRRSLCLYSRNKASQLGDPHTDTLSTPYGDSYHEHA